MNEAGNLVKVEGSKVTDEEFEKEDQEQFLNDMEEVITNTKASIGDQVKLAKDDF